MDKVKVGAGKTAHSAWSMALSNLDPKPLGTDRSVCYLCGEPVPLEKQKKTGTKSWCSKKHKNRYYARQLRERKKNDMGIGTE